jgi:hypothetical protein
VIAPLVIPAALALRYLALVVHGLGGGGEGGFGSLAGVRASPASGARGAG